MRVESSAVELRSWHRASAQVNVEERLEVRLPRAVVSVAPAASAPQDPVSPLDYKSAVALWLYEYLTGDKARVLVMQSGGGAAAPSGGMPSWGVSYSRTETTHEAESTSFSAAGTVTLDSGQSVSFEFQLQMDRARTTVNSVSFRAGNMSDPIVVNLDGLGARLGANRTEFDLNGDGVRELIAQLAAGSAWLARDLNGNGRVDDGRELFGPQTGDGFIELAALDEDHSGWLDTGDAAWSQLGLWRGEDFISLSAAGIGALATANVATPFAQKSGPELLGETRASGIYLREDGTPGALQQVDLST